MLEKLSVVPVNINSQSDELEDLLKEAYRTNEEVLSKESGGFRCTLCKGNRELKKTYDIWDPAPILIFSLQRFKLGKKVTKHVNFPIKDLNVAKFLQDENPQSKSNNLVYDLYATVNHHGSL